MSIEAKNICKRFGTFEVLKNISLTVATGELVALLGPSGSGKTSLLRVIAGLETHDSGCVLFDDEDTSSRLAHERKVGFVFQHYALFRHMTVFDNVAFGLSVMPRKTRPSKETIRKKVMELLHLVQLDFMAQQYPWQLSGGQRQRIALARALAVEPKVMLLDEPFGALDAKVRQELRRWLRRLHDEIHVTSIFVTHDQEEALEVADRVVVMNEGRIEQVGTPEEVYDAPANPFVYNFLGNVNLFHSRADRGKALLGDRAIPLSGPLASYSGNAELYVRPHEVGIDFFQNNPNDFPARVKYIHRAAALVKIEVTTSTGETFNAEMPQSRFRELGLKENDEVFVSLRDVKAFQAKKKE